MKLTGILRTPPFHLLVNNTIERYKQRFNERQTSAQNRLREAAELSREYYTLVTDFYLHGWGKLFHFGVTMKGEDYYDAQVRYEMFLADRLLLDRNEKCLDLGCGVAGPMMNIAAKTGASITGINNCDYQLVKAKGFIAGQGLQQQCRVIACDWMQMPFENNSFDKAYAIEATCHAAENRQQLFTEVHRVLKPGALFAGYDWVMTDNYRPNDREHNFIKQEIEIGNGISNLNQQADVLTALEQAGFQVIECRDRAAECEAGTHWYSPLKGQGSLLHALRLSPAGRWVMQHTLEVLELLRILPKGTSAVHKVLLAAADGLVKGGERGIFTPMLFFLARKR